MTFDIPSSAIAALYGERVAITGTRTGGVSVRGTFAACVMPADSLDPFADDAAQTSVYKRSVLVAKTGEGGWNLPDPPQIGDTVTIGTAAWKVSAVNPHCDDHYALEVRSC